MNNTITEFKILNNFIKYLTHTLKFPDVSIVEGYRINLELIVDVAIIDPDTKKVMAVFEIKKDFREKEAAIRQLNTIQNELKNDVELYFVYYSENEKINFSLYRLNFPTDDLFEISNIPNELNPSKYSVLSPLMNVSERKETVDNFKVLCWIIAFILTIIFILIKCGKLILTSDDLILLALIVGLCILPFIQKFKFLNLEIIRNKDE